VHELDAGEHSAGAAERFEAEHWPGHPFDGTMVLLNDVVEVFDQRQFRLEFYNSLSRFSKLTIPPLLYTDLDPQGFGQPSSA